MNNSRRTAIIAEGIALYAAYADEQGTMAETSNARRRWKIWQSHYPQLEAFVRNEQYKLFDLINVTQFN